MKRINLLIVILINIYIVNAQDTTHILFIGNSITYYNNMPQTFEAIANDKGDTTAVTVYAPGGTGFIHHVNDPNVYNKFRQGIWDFVVLQPGSNESPAYSETKEQTLSRLYILQDSIIKYNPCAKILLYEISYGVWGNTPEDLDTYNNTMSLILSNCQYWADSAQIFFAPAGEAIKTAWNNDTSTMLWGSTGDIHPNAKGSYIIACTFYASIFQKPSFGTTVISSLTQSEANSYQQLADTTVLNHFPDWRINTYNQFTDFDFTINKQNVEFNNLSKNIDSLLWDFGDGDTSTVINPNHLYEENGVYTVTLNTYKGVCTETVSNEVNTNTIGIDDIITPENIAIYPNPFTNRILIDKRLNTDEISIFNALGQNMANNISLINHGQKTEIITTNLPRGMYVLKTKTFAKKVIKGVGKK